MRFTNVAVAVGMAVAVPFIVPVLTVPSAHADFSGYSRCIGNVKQVPLKAPDPLNMQLVGSIEQDLRSGVSPTGEARNLEQMGFDPRVADAVVQCVIQNNP